LEPPVVVRAVPLASRPGGGAVLLACIGQCLRIHRQHGRVYDHPVGAKSVVQESKYPPEYPPTDQVRGHASLENALARLGNAIFWRSLPRLLIRQQSRDDVALRIGARFRETFLEQGQVLPVNVLIHS